MDYSSSSFYDDIINDFFIYCYELKFITKKYLTNKFFIEFKFFF